MGDSDPVTKQDLKALEQKMTGLFEKWADKIISRVEALYEVREEELQGAHQVELDIVAGKRDASPTWKSIPRRLETAEQDIETLKDHVGV